MESVDNQADPHVSRLRFMVRALQSRNYRLFFGGQIVSLVGTWLSMIASSWLVYRLATTGEHPVALMLGLVSFAGQFPVFLLTSMAGVWIDRWNRHSILVVTQTLSMLQSFTLAFLALGHWIELWQLIALSAFQGVVTAFDVPARQTFTVEMVEKREDLSNAIALSSSMMHAARLLGPAIGGYLIYAVGEGYCFLIDGFSYLAVLGALLAMRLKPHVRSTAKTRAWEQFREGLRYAYRFTPIRVLIQIVGITSIAAMSQSTLMPIFAAQILGGQERTLGLLLGASGLGALAGSLYLASRKSVLGLGRVIALACATLGVGLILFSTSTSLWFSVPLLVVIGFAMVVQMASCNTVLQTIVEDDKRGRVMALYSTAFLGLAPVGSLLGGILAQEIGAPWTLTLAGIICLLSAARFAWWLPKIRLLIRPIYQTKGILPQIAAAIEQTTPIATLPQD